ncbi:MAG: hypothetical protein JW908_12740 [Anaerolineales bacterium]|nr:hypothetical protein [Anaerolineales bacterium]
MMTDKLIKICVIAALVGLLTACQSFGLDYFGISGEALFADDFSQPDSGWRRANDEHGSADYLDGIYQIAVSDAQYQVWSSPNLVFADTIIEVDAVKAVGNDNNLFGITCRMQPTQEFYAFLISADGYYGVYKHQENRFQLIGQNAMSPTEAILQGNQVNHLRVDCIGNNLRLYINGEKVAETQDDQFTRGDAGLIAGALSDPGVDIHFDNFTVFKP